MRRKLLDLWGSFLLRWYAKTVKEPTMIVRCVLPTGAYMTTKYTWDNSLAGCFAMALAHDKMIEGSKRLPDDEYIKGIAYEWISTKNKGWVSVDDDDIAYEYGERIGKFVNGELVKEK